MENIPLKLIREIVSGKIDAKDILHEAFREKSPVYRLFNMRLLMIREGYAEIEFPYKEELSRIGGMLHGGAIMTVIDQVCGLAAMTVNKGVNQVTMELKINFLKPLTKETQPYTAVGEVIRAGRTTIVCEGKVFNAKGDVCAVGIGTWYVFTG